MDGSFDCVAEIEILSFVSMTEHTIIQIALWIGSAYLALNLYALLISDRLLFQPRQSEYAHLPHETRIPTTDGETLNAVWLEHPSPKATLLFSHGNAEDLNNVYPFVRQFCDRGYSVLMYDYRGYGTSEGKPSYRKVKDDATAAWRWLVEEQNIDPKTIVAHGRSLGGAVAVWTAAHHETGGLIVESSFTSAFRVKTIVPLLPWDKFNSAVSIKSINCPVLIMHGTKDQILPLWHGKALFDAALEPKRKLWIKDAEHMNYAYVAGDAYFHAIQSFLDSLSTPK